jgi:plastocyanin
MCNAASPMPIVRSLAALLGILVLVAACTGGGSAASSSPPPDADATINAQGNVFQPAELRLAADENQEVFFRNLDGVPHNIAIYADSSLSETLYSGEVITDSARLYEIPAMRAGRFFFRCDVHPEMTGTVVVGG